MILEYYGKTVSGRDIGLIAKTTIAHGTTPEGLLRAAKHYGLTGKWSKASSIDDLKKHIKKGTPVIVDWFSSYEGHYSVAVGATRNRIAILDPETGKRRTFSNDEFMRVWFDFTGTWIKNRLHLRVRWMLPLSVRKLDIHDNTLR